MILADVMDELGAALDTITGLRVYAWPADSVQVPAAVVGYPETIDYDVTYGRGVDHLEIPVFVLVGRVSERAARDALGAYCDGSGAASIKTVLETAAYTAATSVRVASATFEAITVNATEYLAATFTVDVYGAGGS